MTRDEMLRVVLSHRNDISNVFMNVISRIENLGKDAREVCGKIEAGAIYVGSWDNQLKNIGGELPCDVVVRNADKVCYLYKITD